MICQLCSRDVESIEKHHLYPVKTRRVDKTTILVCQQCGNQVHLLFTNSELQNEFNTLDALLQSPKIQTYIQWVKDKPDNHFSCAKKKRKK